MKEIIVNTAINLTKKELIKHGCDEFIEQSMLALRAKATNGIIDLIANDLNDEDYSQIMHFCKMLASTIPVMELNEDFRELVHRYVMSMKGLEYDVELEDKPKVIGEDGNVIQIDFGTKTEGSA